jgi:hypothetical protein
MSATAGTAGTLTQQGQALGERPQWALPYGLTFGGWEQVQRYFMRSDTPNGISTDTPTPEANQAFRNAVLAGQIVPMNDAAGRLVVTVGGIQNGMMSPFGVPWIDGKPGGMTTQQWDALTAQARQQSDQRIAEAEASGVFNGMPTLARQQAEAQIRSQDFQDATTRMLTEANIRQKDEDLRRLEVERQDAVRAGDLGRAQELAVEQDRQLLQRQTLTGYIGGEGGMGPGGQATLAREQQAFEQAQAAAEAAANPRTALQAWMAGGQRNGLNGAAPANFVPPTTTAPTVPGAPGMGVPGAPPGAIPGASPYTPGSVPGVTGAPQSAFQQAQAATANQTGLGAWFQVPTSAAQQALIENRPVPTQGAVQGTGRWWNSQDLQRAVNPGQWRSQDWDALTRDEQAGAQGLASFAGFSDQTTEDLINRNRPRFRAPTSGMIGG